MEYLTLQDIPHRHFYGPRRMASPEDIRASERALPGMAANHHLRHSPPLQPGEQRGPGQTDKLPSFKQLMANVQEPSPPRTPSRRTDSMESSPVSRGPPAVFGDIAWSDVGKRRRIDSAYTDIRPSISSEAAYADSRHPSLIDPALSGPYSDPRNAHQPSGYQHAPAHHHRPSLPYATPPASTIPSSHVRHQSTPVPYGHHRHAPYQHHGPSSSAVAPQAYPPPHPSNFGEHRPSYHSDPHPAAPANSEYRPHDPYYGQPQSAYPPPPPPGYDGAYHAQPQPAYNSYTFQSSMGMDQSGFNRKRRGNLPKEATAILKAWFASHRDSPYPTEDEKVELCRQTQLSMNQVSNWFINARRRAPQKEQRDAREPVEEA